jgi:hypothetical protein
MMSLIFCRLLPATLASSMSKFVVKPAVLARNAAMAACDGVVTAPIIVVRALGFVIGNFQRVRVGIKPVCFGAMRNDAFCASAIKDSVAEVVLLTLGVAAPVGLACGSCPAGDNRLYAFVKHGSNPAATKALSPGRNIRATMRFLF